MKTKMDFVTNSSSTSFVAWGISMERSELSEKYGEAIYKYLKTNGDDRIKKDLETISFEEFCYDIYEYVWDGIAGLDTAARWEDDIMIGGSPDDMKSDQTKNEFKQEICENFAKIGIEMTPETLEWIQEGWMDG